MLKRIVLVAVLALTLVFGAAASASADEYCYNDERYDWTYYQSDGQWDFYYHYVVCTDQYSYWDDYGPYHGHSYFTPYYSP